MIKNTIEALQKLKVDCLYKKNTHANAARRLYKEAKQFKNFLIVGSALASISIIMNIGLWDTMKTPVNYNYILVIQIIFNLIGAAGGLFVFYGTYFSDYYIKMEQATQHELVCTDLNLTHKKIRNIEAIYLDSQLSDEMLKEKLESLTEEYSAKINSVPITENIDFEKAREDFQKGYSTEYTEKELNS